MVLTNAVNVARRDTENRMPSPMKPGHQQKRRHQKQSSRTLVVRARSTAEILVTSGPSRVSTTPLGPSVDVEMSDVMSAPMPQRPVCAFPNVLPRLPFRAISRKCIERIDPELADVPVEFIREGLAAHAAEMQRPMFGVASNKLSLSGPLPLSMRVKFQRVLGILPTHLLAVTPLKRNQAAYAAAGKRPIIVPVHSLVLASYCASPAALMTLSGPPSDTTLDSDQSAEFRLSSLAVPMPEAFLGLSRFLYFRDLEMFYKDILPASPPVRTSGMNEQQYKGRCHGFSTWMARTVTPVVLNNYAKIIVGTHQNAIALGIYDDLLVEGLDFAWDLMRNALQSMQKPSPQTSSSSPVDAWVAAQKAQVALQNAATSAASTVLS